MSKIHGTPALVLLLLFTPTINCQVELGPQNSANLRQHHLTISKHHDEPADDGQAAGSGTAKPVYLESMEDLEHVAYMSMRNFNLTSDSLLQASWLRNSLGGNPSQHKQHQPNPSASLDIRVRLEMQLESFISHLRNGHLRRLRVDELAAIVETLNAAPQNLVPIYEQANTLPPEQQIVSNNETGNASRTRPEATGELTSRHELGTATAVPRAVRDGAMDRCRYLVAIYQLELKERQAATTASSEASPSTQSQQESKIEYESAGTDEKQRESMATGALASRDRLMNLCRLATKCNSADELVQLIDGAWQPTRQQAERQVAESRVKRTSGRQSGDDLSNTSPGFSNMHDDDGFCSIRRDDRPPMLTVWGFATLFVTIVSFCSLIGLSIIPFLGPVSDDSSDSETPNGSYSAAPAATPLPARRRHTSGPPGGDNLQLQRYRHRACLTLFEGLAVGSLVGSALFSLIPQAFELQERESNQGFLLKALIIFFGIYLFFCSERLMRIILDARQLRKKRKRLFNHRSSNSIQMHSTTADYFYQPVQSQLSVPTKDTVSPIALALHNRSPLDENYSKSSVSGKSKRSSSCKQAAINMPGGGGPTVKSQSKSVKTMNPTSSQPDNGRRRRRVTDSGAGEHQHQHIETSQEQSAIGKASMGADLPANKSNAGKGASSDVKQRPTRRQTRRKLLATARRRRKRRNARQVGSPENNIMNDPDSFRLRARRNSTSSSSSSSDGSLSSNTFTYNSSFKPNQQIGSTRPSAGFAMGAPDLYCCQSSSSSVVDGADERSADELQTNHELSSSMGANKWQATKDLGTKRYLRTRASFRLAEDQRRTEHDDDDDNYFITKTPNEQDSAKRDISTVAWMIIIGDGLHNFIDGISIGAAFSESILGGVSISAAVVLEELPSELGDFSVLLSGNMSVRQSLGYNLLSACTCYLGMAVGIIFGDVIDGASYLSALTAGVFLYIALVDMMGELSATLEETSRNSIAKTLKLLLLQNVGIFIGISIIYILSYMDF